VVDYKEIPESVLLQSNIPVVVEKFRKRALSYKLVKSADLKFELIKGARVSADRFLFDSLGKVSIELTGMPCFVLAFSGIAEYKREERRVYLTEFKVLNDIAGFANKLIEATGIGVGRSLHVSERDDALLLPLFPEGCA